MSTLHDEHPQAAIALERNVESAVRPHASGDTAPQTLSSRILMACVFWSLCLTLTAAGHRFYKAIVKLDRQVSAGRYRTDGAPLVWIGHGSVEAARQQIVGTDRTVDVAELHVLPNSVFWLSTAACFTILAGLIAWSGRWIANSGFQSLIGLFAGHLLWLGAIEFGLESAGRRLGLAGSLELVGDKVAGTHGAGILIQLSVVFLIPVLIGLTMHESNRCALFQWFRRRLPITRTAAASGRVENYAARTTIQYFMTVWFCYVSVLWLADPRLGSFGHNALWITMLSIGVATPYMIWRTAQQPGIAQSLRYSVSGAVVTWTAIEIAAAMRFFEEPWLSDSFASGAVILGLSILLTGLVVHMLRPADSASLLTPRHAAAALAVLAAGAMGCTRSNEPKSLTAEIVEKQLREYGQRIQRPSAAATDGLHHALYSRDPEMRAQAAIAFGKSRRVSTAVKERLESMAKNDQSRLSQFAALTALGRLNLLSPKLQSLLSDFGNDPEWSFIAKMIEQ